MRHHDIADFSKNYHHLHCSAHSCSSSLKSPLSSQHPQTQGVLPDHCLLWVHTAAQVSAGHNRSRDCLVLFTHCCGSLCAISLLQQIFKFFRGYRSSAMSMHSLLFSASHNFTSSKVCCAKTEFSATLKRGNSSLRLISGMSEEEMRLLLSGKTADDLQDSNK